MKLDAFIQKLLPDFEQSKIPEIQQDYDKLIEDYLKLIVMTKEEFDSLDRDINNYEIKVNSLNSKIDSLTSEIKSYKELISEMQKKTSDYRELKINLNSLENKYNCCYKDNVDLSLKIREDKELMEKLRKQITDLKNDNFEKFEEKSNLEKEIISLKEKIQEIKDNSLKLVNEKNNLKQENKSLSLKLINEKGNLEDKINILERQIKQLQNANLAFAQENSEVNVKLKDFQILTNMRKACTRRLKDSDFSILETMSKRAEDAELLIHKLNTEIEKLKNDNESLNKKINPLEKYMMLLIKNESDVNPGNVIKSKVDISGMNFSENDEIQIKNFKNQPDKLINLIIKLKSDNLLLQSQLRDITIECNHKLREASKC